MLHLRAPRQRPTRLLTGLLALGVVVVSAAACTPNSPRPNNASGASPTSSRVSATPPPTFSGTQHPLPSGKALTNEPDLYKIVSLTGCSAQPHGWRATGTADNKGRASLKLTIVVLFTDAQARDIDSATTTVHAAPGKNSPWTAARTFRAPAGTRCVIRAVQPG
jgi:hypothetical protein